MTPKSTIIAIKIVVTKIHHCFASLAAFQELCIQNTCAKRLSINPYSGILRLVKRNHEIVKNVSHI